MDRRQILKGLGGLFGSLPQAASTLPAAVQSIPSTTANEILPNTANDIVSVLVGKRARLKNVLKLAAVVGHLPENISFLDAMGNDLCWKYESLAPSRLWIDLFTQAVHGTHWFWEKKNSLDQLEKIELAQITSATLSLAYDYAGQVGENIDEQMESIKRLQDMGLRTVGDVYKATYGKMMNFLPDVVQADVERGFAKNASIQDNLDHSLRGLLKFHPDIFEEFSDIRDRVRSIYQQSATTGVLIKKIPSLSKKQKKALAAFNQEKRRFSVRQAETKISEWRVFEIDWSQKETEPTRVQFHLLRLKLCRPKRLATDIYRPGDIKVEFGSRKRSVTLSTRDELMQRHLVQCIDGRRALFIPRR